MKKILQILIITLLAFNINAADHKFSYQGELIDGGLPAGGSSGVPYDIAIQAFDAAEFGSTVGTVSIHSGIIVTNGLFSIDDVDLGIATYDGLALWLQISVKKPADASFTNLSPLQKMTSVPYATTLIDKGATNGQVLTFDNATGWQPATPASDFDGVFSSLTGVPAGLADGDDDTQLTEAQVDGFTDNNGYVNTSDTTAWDKNAADDFSGNYLDLTNEPWTFDGTTISSNVADISIVNDSLRVGVGNKVNIYSDEFQGYGGIDFHYENTRMGSIYYSGGTAVGSSYPEMLTIEAELGTSTGINMIVNTYPIIEVSDSQVSLERDTQISGKLKMLGKTEQHIDLGGMVKYMVGTTCGQSGSAISKQFNGTLISGLISVANGATAGRCTLTFPDSIGTRFWITSPAIDANISSNCKISSGNKLNCRSFTPNTGAGLTAEITVIVY